MTKLLVSVRSSEEAAAALSGGADLIDVKEPAKGPLGRASREVQQAILASVAGRAPVSAALGELGDRAMAPCPGIAFAKWGLAGASAGWRDHWRIARGVLPEKCEPVAVAYADGELVSAPPLFQVLEFAMAERAGAFLIDTALKNGRTLRDYLSLPQLRDILSEARRHAMPVALAGSLDAAAIEHLLPLCPDWIAVRGAACSGGRAGVVSEERVRHLVRLVHSAPLDYDSR